MREVSPLIEFYIFFYSLSVQFRNDLYHDPGLFLKLCRMRASMTQEQLADKLFRSRSTVSKIENNQIKIDVPTFISWLENTNFRTADLQNIFEYARKVNILHSVMNETEKEEFVNALVTRYIRLLKIISGIQDKEVPVFLVPNQDAEQQLNDLQQAIQALPLDIRESIEQKIKEISEGE